MILGSRSEKTKFVVVTSKEDSQSIKGGLSLIKNFKQTDPNGVNVLDLVNHDKIVFTKKSLEEFERLFLAWTFEQYRP
jgi:ribosomal protein L4